MSSPDAPTPASADPGADEADAADPGADEADAAGGGATGRRPWGRAGRVVRPGVGAVSIVLGLAAGAVSLTSGPGFDPPLLVCAAVLTLGGATLLVLPRLRPRPSRAGRLAGGATTVIGLALAALLPVRQACCDAAVTFSWGLPLPWTSAGGDTPAQAYAGLSSALASADALSVGADVLFWLYAGLVVAVAVGMAWRAGQPGSQGPPRAALGDLPAEHGRPDRQ